LNLGLDLHTDEGGNQLSGEIPSEIWNFTRLELLVLSNNQFIGEIPSEIGNLTNLTWLDLSNNFFSGEFPYSICDLGFFDYYSLGENKLCPPYPDCLTEEDIGYQDTSECIECEGEYGDLNQDGFLDVLDIVTGVNIIIENISYTDCQLYLLDFNGDGSTDVLDIVGMVNYIIFD